MRNRRQKVKNPRSLVPTLVALTALFQLSGLYRAETALGAVDREQESARIAQGLRAYSDQDWVKIAGGKSSEKYEIAKGDTLWSISGRLFGEPRVWPKVWEINNAGILNPHMIEPKTNLIFNAGSALSLPSLSLKSTGITTVKNHYKVEESDRPGPIWDEKTPMPGNEWKYLPRQAWENVPAALPPDIDKDGFDGNNRIYLRKPATGLNLPQIVSCSPLDSLGTVVGSRNMTSYTHAGAELTVQASGNLETGKVYSVVSGKPAPLSSKERKAFAYEVAGRVRVLGSNKGVHIVQLLSSQAPLARGAFLIPEIKKISRSAPRAGKTNVRGSLIADRSSSAFMSGQNKWVFIDRGTRDGVERDMIFRIFQNIDPETGKKLTPDEVFVKGDVQIHQGCENFSIGTFVWSQGEVPERYEGQLLGDVSDKRLQRFFDTTSVGGKFSDIPPPSSKAALSVEMALPSVPAKKSIVGPSVNPELLEPLPPEPLVETPVAPPVEEFAEPPLETALPELPDPETEFAPLPEAPPLEELPPPAAKAPTTPNLDDDGEDWLDQLDNHQALNSEEERELFQLEQFREGQQLQASPGLPPPPAASLDTAPEETAPLPLPPAPESLSAGAADFLPPPPPGEEEFPSEEPIVEVPLGPQSTQSAQGPKMDALPPPPDEFGDDAGFEDESLEGLPPL
jgi:hypothetical protein